MTRMLEIAAKQTLRIFRCDERPMPLSTGGVPNLNDYMLLRRYANPLYQFLKAGV